MVTHRRFFHGIWVTKCDEIKRAEDALTQLRDAAYIRASRLFGYPVGDESDGTETGDTPMLPHWLWSEDGGSEPGAQRRRQGGKTYGQL